MTAKKEQRGAMRDIPRKQPLASNTIAFYVLKRLYDEGTLKPADLHNLMPDRRQNTATVFNYVERLENLGYASTNQCDQISITELGREFVEDKPQASTPKHFGIPAAPRVVSIWTPPMQGYEASMRACRRSA